MNHPRPAFAVHAALPFTVLPSLVTLKGIRTEKIARDSINDIGAFIDDWITLADFKVAKACLELLFDKKCKNEILMRGDGETPSVLHELTQAIYTIALATHHFPLPDVERLICLNFIHDLGEEFDVSVEELRHHLRQKEIQDEGVIEDLCSEFEALTKTYKDAQGHTIKKYPTNREYFISMCGDPHTMLGKYLDRIHNMATLIGVKKDEKIREYILETLELMTCFRAHENQYPKYEQTFHTLRKILSAQILFTTDYYKSRHPEDSLPHLIKVQLSGHSPLSPESIFDLSERNVPRGLDALLIPDERVRGPKAAARAREKPLSPQPLD